MWDLALKGKLNFYVLDVVLTVHVVLHFFYDLDLSFDRS